MIRSLTALCLLACALDASAEITLRFNMINFTSRNVNFPITLTPPTIAVSGTNIATSPPFKIYPTNGVAYASNLLAVDYTLTIEATGAKQVLSVFETNGVIDAASLISPDPTRAAGLAYSKTASDARYALKGESGGGSWFESDGSGDLMPALTISGSDSHWEQDSNGDLQPK